MLNDITDTVGSVFLGLTLGCARCHDHKFDPILQKDYYRLQAFFANISARDDLPLLHAEQPGRIPAASMPHGKRRRTTFATQIDATGRTRSPDEAMPFAGSSARAPDVQAVVETPAEQRTPLSSRCTIAAQPS